MDIVSDELLQNSSLLLCFKELFSIFAPTITQNITKSNDNEQGVVVHRRKTAIFHVFIAILETIKGKTLKLK